MYVLAKTKHGAGQLQDLPEAVQSIEFHARSTNHDAVYVGMSDVSESDGRELIAGEATTWVFADMPGSGQIKMDEIYLAGTGACDWVAILG